MKEVITENHSATLESTMARDSLGRVRWLDSFSGEELTRKIEEMAQDFVAQGNPLTARGLRLSKRWDLKYAIFEFYPGRLKALKEKLGVDATKKESGFWQIETIESEAQKFLAEHEGISLRLLREANRWDLDGAIRANYPGSIRQLRKNLRSKDPAREVLQAYQELLDSGRHISFGEFVRQRS